MDDTPDVMDDTPAVFVSPAPAAPAGPAAPPDTADGRALAFDSAMQQWEAARERIGAAIDRQTMTHAEAAAVMQAYWNRVEASRSGQPVEPVREEPGRQLSSDPAEAAMGLMAPETPDVHAIERLLAHYPDMNLTTREAQTFVRAIGAKVPRELVPDATTLIRTLAMMAPRAREQAWTAERGMQELVRRHGEKRAAGLVEDAAKVWQELGGDRTLFQDDWIEDDPDAIEKLAEFSDKFYATDTGLRLTLKRNAVAVAAQDRERAAEAARDRALEERFRYDR